MTFRTVIFGEMTAVVHQSLIVGIAVFPHPIQSGQFGVLCVQLRNIIAGVVARHTQIDVRMQRPTDLQRHIYAVDRHTVRLMRGHGHRDVGVRHHCHPFYTGRALLPKHALILHPSPLSGGYSIRFHFISTVHLDFTKRQTLPFYKPHFSSFSRLFYKLSCFARDCRRLHTRHENELI